MSPMKTLRAALLAGASLLTTGAAAQTAGWAGVSSEPVAQAMFDQGWRQAHHGDRASAIRAFRAAQWRDPRCHMCFWAEAWAYGPGVDDQGLSLAAEQRARRALAEAQRLAPRSGAARDLTEALAARYGEGTRVARDQAYARAMLRTYDRFEDVEVAVLAAEALAVAQGGLFYSDNGQIAAEETPLILAMLDAALGRGPLPPTSLWDGAGIAPKPEHEGALRLRARILEDRAPAPDVVRTEQPATRG